MEYVVFSMDALQEMAFTIWHNVGSIFSVALYCFVVVLGVHLVLNLVSYLAR